ncbi:uncharacterized protein LOC110099521 [Dendrobium catenatum]|uniref:uncharacterized protein LOC110099521 n=1 Tax=Dendrobium catenatum TaxID=906689 RepID=UPI0009F5E50B|nr:uncharacterized protein LOC110099521 [Dendrobium catenatum]
MVSAWNMKPNFKSIDFDYGENFSKNGVVKLHLQSEVENTNKLQKSLVVKVFGDSAPYHIIGLELRKKWNQNGRFHMTFFGGGWILCAFEDLEAMDSILNSGPWYVNGSINGLDKWSPNFHPSSLKGLMALVWIRLPNLPLQSWDKINVYRIALKVGTLFLIDDNMFQWGLHEFARVCVRINLEDKLPLGFWAEGVSSKFYQKISYEKMPNICFKCGNIEHLEKFCPELYMESILVPNKPKVNSVEGGAAVMKEIPKDNSLEKDTTKAKEDNCGPWIHVDMGTREEKTSSFRTSGLDNRLLRGF